MTAQLIETLNNFNKQHILIIGDMIADVYLHGEISRISREAPVLVLLESQIRTVPGGAANVVNNVASLGGIAYAIGVMGDDKEGENLRETLHQHQINTQALLADKDRKTITKTRVLAGGRATVSQQVVRIDREYEQPLSPEQEEALLMALSKLIPKAQGIILSDYGSGTITPKICQHILKLCKEYNIPNMVDSRYAIGDFVGVDYIKQNDAELASAVEKELNSPKEVLAAGKIFLDNMQAKGVLVTRGEDGMLLILANGEHYFIPVSDKSEVFDVSGAGDTCVAAFVTALAAGATPLIAAKLSNYAAGIAVRKIGTATVTAKELEDTIIKFSKD